MISIPVVWMGTHTMSGFLALSSWVLTAETGAHCIIGQDLSTVGVVYRILRRIRLPLSSRQVRGILLCTRHVYDGCTRFCTCS